MCFPKSSLFRSGTELRLINDPARNMIIIQLCAATFCYEISHGCFFVSFTVRGIVLWMWSEMYVKCRLMAHCLHTYVASRNYRVVAEMGWGWLCLVSSSRTVFTRNDARRARKLGILLTCGDTTVDRLRRRTPKFLHCCRTRNQYVLQSADWSFAIVDGHMWRVHFTFHALFMLLPSLVSSLS